VKLHQYLAQDIQTHGQNQGSDKYQAPSLPHEEKEWVLPEQIMKASYSHPERTEEGSLQEQNSTSS
jgi:hypothetical protein